MSDADDQNDEIMALASIYENTTFCMQKDSEMLNTGTLKAHVELPKPQIVMLSAKDVKHEIQHLPPIVMSFTLPQNYPSTKPPQYSLSCVWLSQDLIREIRKEFDERWSSSQGCAILFTWMSFLQCELLDFLQIQWPMAVNAEAFAAIISHDQVMRKQKFNLSTFACEVCFEDKPGSQCTRFENCGHVFCRSCVQGYLEMHISEGSVGDLKCLSHKCPSSAVPSQVKELVTPELYERYDRLLLQRTLDTMTDVVYCPRKTCNSPVLIDQKESMGSCPLCRYVFCIYCKMVYHGISPCRLVEGRMNEIREQYLAADEQGKRELEKRYGRQNIRRAVEESFSVQWVNENCKKCPQCQTQIQKRDGCNKMTCTKCHAYFCWLCLSKITHKDPYSHFNDTSSPCYNRLFLGVVQDDIDRDFLDDDEDFLIF